MARGTGKGQQGFHRNERPAFDPRQVQQRAAPLAGGSSANFQRHRECQRLFTGDSLAWSMREQDLVAFRDACWYSWRALTESLAKLAGYRFEWVLPGHGWPAHREASEMQARLQALVIRMRES